MGPWKTPAGRHGMDVRHIATFLPCSTCQRRMPASSSAHSNVNEQPSRNATRSSRQYGARRPARDGRPPHRDVLAVLHVPEADAGLEQRPLERERAAEQERDEVVAPVRRGVRHLVGQLAVRVDPVAREVGSEIGARGDADGLGRAHVGDLEERARPRVALAEEEEVVGHVLRQHREVRLDVVLTQPRRDARQLAVPDVPPDLPRLARVDRHSAILPPPEARRVSRSRESDDAIDFTQSGDEERAGRGARPEGD